jgi:hypothetical protein
MQGISIDEMALVGKWRVLRRRIVKILAAFNPSHSLLSRFGFNNVRSSGSGEEVR